MSVLYLSYDGLMEQLGQSQVLPYLRQLAKGRKITLITYEKENDFNDTERKARFKKIAHDSNIFWIPLRYHKGLGLLAKIYDLAVGFVVGAFICVRGKVRIVHARGFMVSVVALVLKQVFGVQYIFDMRGFWVDQRVEMGLWQEESRIFGVAKWLEHRFLQKADAVFVLNSAAVKVLNKWPAVQGRSIRFEVVTTCTDIEIFKPPSDNILAEKNDSFTLGYVGSAGQGYLFEPVLDFFAELQKIRPGSRLMIVNRNDHLLILSLIKKCGIDTEAIELVSSDHKDVPGKIWQMDAGIYFVRPAPSRIASVPTRLGEFLACGVPCVGNAGIGDVEEILDGEGVGVVVRNFDSESIKVAAVSLVQIADDSECKARCLAAAKRHFSLEVGVATYEKVYCDLEKKTW